MFLRAKIPIFLSGLARSLKEFLWLKDLSLFVFKGWKNQRKRESMGNFFLIFISISFLYFFQVFFFVICFPNTLYSHT